LPLRTEKTRSRKVGGQIDRSMTGKKKVMNFLTRIENRKSRAGRGSFTMGESTCPGGKKRGAKGVKEETNTERRFELT